MSFKTEAVEVSQYRVAEIFGPTIQGEGPFVGEPCYFIRLGGCDYRCSWCDSMHAVLPEEVQKLPRMTAGEIVRQVKLLDINVEWGAGVPAMIDLVVLSGGNPAVYTDESLIRTLIDQGFRIQVETQGSIWREWLRLADAIVVSPKPPSSGEKPKIDRLRSFALQGNSYGTNIYWKFVAFDRDDLWFAKTICDQFQIRRAYISVGTKIEDTTETLIDRWRGLIPLAEDAFRFVRTNIQIFPQQHVLLWGHVKGV